MDNEAKLKQLNQELKDAYINWLKKLDWSVGGYEREEELISMEINDLKRQIEFDKEFDRWNKEFMDGLQKS